MSATIRQSVARSRAAEPGFNFMARGGGGERPATSAAAVITRTPISRGRREPAAREPRAAARPVPLSPLARIESRRARPASRPAPGAMGQNQSAPGGAGGENDKVRRSIRRAAIARAAITALCGGLRARHRPHRAPNGAAMAGRERLNPPPAAQPAAARPSLTAHPPSSFPCRTRKRRRRRSGSRRRRRRAWARRRAAAARPPSAPSSRRSRRPRAASSARSSSSASRTGC